MNRSDPDDKKPEKELKPEAGLNRFVWDLRYDEAHHVPGYYLWEYGSGARGPIAVPGHYQVRLTVGAQTQTAGLDLKLDPRVQVSQADLEQQFNLLLQTRDELSRVYDAVNQIQDVRSQLSGLKRGCRKMRARRRLRRRLRNWKRSWLLCARNW